MERETAPVGIVLSRRPARPLPAALRARLLREGAIL